MPIIRTPSHNNPEKMTLLVRQVTTKTLVSCTVVQQEVQAMQVALVVEQAIRSHVKAVKTTMRIFAQI